MRIISENFPFLTCCTDNVKQQKTITSINFIDVLLTWKVNAKRLEIMVPCDLCSGGNP